MIFAQNFLCGLLLMLGTCSKMKVLGLRFMMKLTAPRIVSLRSSARPPLFPILENGWHWLPVVYTSTSPSVPRFLSPPSSLPVAQSSAMTVLEERPLCLYLLLRKALNRGVDSETHLHFNFNFAFLVFLSIAFCVQCAEGPETLCQGQHNLLRHRKGQDIHMPC